MKITNKHNLPEAFVRAVEAHPYSRGDADISCTGLIGPPLIQRLECDHRDEIEEDIIDKFWAIRGTIIHHILETGAPDDCLPETRLFADVEGWRLSGQLDAYFPNEGLLQDWKETSVAAAFNLPKPEWEKQLNILAYLVRRNGGDISRLEVVAMYRDWSMRKAKRGGNYPCAKIEVIPIKIWDNDFTCKYIATRIQLHQEAIAATKIEDVPICTAEEIWQQSPVWAIMKEGRKSAVKLHETEEDAKAHLKSLSSQHSIVYRPGECTRCLYYCRVNQWCPYWQKYLLTQSKTIDI